MATRIASRWPRRLGFDAYGATQDAPDPVAHAINCMLDHLHVVDRKMEEMCASLRRLGLDEDLNMPEIESCEIVSTAEELQRLAREVGAEIGGEAGDAPAPERPTEKANS